MLATCRDDRVDYWLLRGRDVADEAGQWRHEAENKCNNSTPVGGISGRVAVDAMEVVHVGHGDSAATDDVVTIGD